MKSSSESDKQTVCVAAKFTETSRGVWNQTKWVSCGWSRAAAVRTNIPSSGPPAASQAGSDPAAWCSEGGGHSGPTDTYRVGLVLMQQRGRRKKKKEHKNHIYIHLQSFERAVQSRAGAKCHSLSAKKQELCWCMFRKPSSRCDIVFILIYTHDISTYQM